MIRNNIVDTRFQGKMYACLTIEKKIQGLLLEYFK
jgi:hypothetical protein